MTPPKPQKIVQAKVVDVDKKIEPIESIVVGDNRNTLGKRLGLFAVALLLLFFAISSYIQSAKNGSLLHRAAVDRSNLIRTIDSQTKLIKQLQTAIRIQNKELKKAGFKTVRIPGSNHTTQPIIIAPQPSQSHQSTPAPAHNSHNPGPKPSNSPHPKPTHSPHPGPVQQAKNKVCSLTGICLFNFVSYLKFF